MIDSEKVYGLKDPIWFPPLNVIRHYKAHLDPMSADQKISKEFRKADEVFVAAIALLGIQLEGAEPYWMQAVPDSEHSPDVRSGRWVPAPISTRAPNFEMQDVEVVGFFPESGEDIPIFLTRTKLSKQKAYDPRTTILCHIQKNISIPSLQTITKTLQGNNAVCPVIVLGRTHPTRKDYILFQVHPQFKVIAKYNIEEILKNHPDTRVLNLQRGSKPKNESHPEEKHCPFESLGFACPLI
jgi:hypothetical protein